MNMSSGRATKVPSSMRIERADNGGYTVTHHHDNHGAGESYTPSTTHVFPNHHQMMKHVKKTYGAPGPNSFGAGVD